MRVSELCVHFFLATETTESMRFYLSVTEEKIFAAGEDAD